MASGGGPPSGGFGRGGRGWAIMEALKKEQAQTPGQAPAPTGGGRGSLLALGRAAAALQPPTQTPTATPQLQQAAQLAQLQSAAAPRPASGRGSAAGLLALVQQKQQQGGQPARGRGALLAHAAAAAAATQKPAPGVAPAPVSMAPPGVPQAAAGEPAAPVGAMARMGIRESEEPPREHVRRPAVSRRGDYTKAGGQASRLAVNSVRLRAKNKNIYQYHVNFSPIVDSKGMRVGLLNEHRDTLPVKLFDGTIMFLPNKLDQDELQLTSTRKTDGATITILIRLTKALPIEQCPQLYNILLRKIMSLMKLVQVGRYYYNPATPSKVREHQLEVWPGYITSIGEQEGGLLLLLDSSHRVLRCQTVLDLISVDHLLGNFYKFIWEMDGQEYICQVRDQREDKQDVLINFLTKEGDLYTWPAKPDLSWEPAATFLSQITLVMFHKQKAIFPAEMMHASQRTFQEDATRKIVGCTVLTRYNNKTYRVDDIDWGKTPQNSFESSSGEEITFADYYLKQYGKKVDLQQPLLVHRPKARKINGQTVQPRTELLCLIPELCHLTGLTDDLRSNFRVMKDLSAHTRCTPNQRLATMKKFVDSVTNNPEALQQLENWGLSLDDSALAVEGGRMKMETIFFGNGKSASAGHQADWGRDLCRNKVITPVDLVQWAIFYVKRNGPDINNFLQEVVRTGPQLGIQIAMPALVSLDDDRTETLIKMLRQLVNPNTQLVCVVMPTSREDKYSAIKKFACVECPVPSQVIVHKTIRDKAKLRSVTQKIILQINCKLGGELWAVKNPLETAMVVGIDSFHDVARGRNSIGGFVASTNPELTRWFSRCCMQMRGEELVPGLRMFMLSAVRKYYELNHRRPEKIIVFRDGVGDGQMAIVQDFEVRQMEESFRDFGADYHPKLTVVIVQKRINTRIFQQGQGGSLDNPPPGTVLDHTVTRRDMYDYFLVSQHVRQGTVSPTHYVVVHDEINLPPERMQVMTYKMTHLYYNWPGTVRVPAPCLYAHKLAYLVGESIHSNVSELLSDRLFFL